MDKPTIGKYFIIYIDYYNTKCPTGKAYLTLQQLQSPKRKTYRIIEEPESILFKNIANWLTYWKKNTSFGADKNF